MAAQATAPPVLTPETTQRVREAFEASRDVVRYERITVDRDHITARLCTVASGACFGLRLDPPDARCATQGNSSFCITFPDGAPEEASRERIVRELEARFPASSWASATDDRVMHRSPGLAALLALLPVGVGVALGLSLRRRRVRRPAVMLALVVFAPLLLTNAVNLVWPTIGIWDLSLAALLLSLGMVVGQAAPSWRVTVLTTGALFTGVLVVEGLTRVRLARLPDFSMESVLLSEAEADQQPGDAVCQVAYGHWNGSLKRLGRYVRAPQVIGSTLAQTHRVLHLGDSMVFGVGVEENETFVAALARQEPGTDHVNAGIPATAPDGYLAALFGWTKAEPFERVVLYLFAGNDLDLDAASPCCGWRPVLKYEGERAALRCTQPTAQQGVGARARWILHYSRPPYVLKFLAHYSQAIAYATVGVFALAERRAPGSEVAYQHLESILRTASDYCRDRHVALTVVVLPDRAALEGRTTTTRDVATRMVQLSRTVGVDTLDATAPLQQAVSEGRPIFLNVVPNDFHLSPMGHELLGSWLSGELRKLAGAR